MSVSTSYCKSITRTNFHAAKEIIYTEIPEYACPSGYRPLPLDWENRRYWRLRQFGSEYSPKCALKDTRYRCTRGAKRRNFMKFSDGIIGYFLIHKVSRFSNPNPATINAGYSSSVGDSSVTEFQVNFAVKAFYVKVRGVSSMQLFFSGPITRTVSGDKRNLKEYCTRTCMNQGTHI